MAKQLMFYEKVVPVNKARHAGWSVAQERGGYAFAAESIAAPVMTAEFLSIATEYPIVFGKGGAGYAPLAMLGIQTGKSLFVDGQGSWTGGYIPAFIRRYPFAFTQSANGETYTLCIDEAYAGCDPEGGSGEKLFEAGGEPAPYLSRALEFTRNFEVENRRTREFCKLLEDHGLLDEMHAAIAMPSGEKRSLRGFFVVSRERLKALEGDALAEFFRRDVLELVYYHLASMRNLEKLRQRAAAIA